MSDCVHCVPCTLQRIEKTLKRMEANMASEVDQLNQIITKVTQVHADVKAKLDEVRGEVSDEGQAKFNQVLDALDSFDQEVAANPVVSDPGTPADGSTPADSGTVSDGSAPADGTVAPGTDENGTPLDADGNPAV